MLAAMLSSKWRGSVRLTEVPDPEPGPGWVRLRVRRVGICGTDKALYSGSYPLKKDPLIPGHEILGIVDSVGDGVEEDLIGMRATTEINVSCGECWFCRHGMRTHCPHRKALGISADGGMAEFVLTPRENLWNVEGLTDVQAAFVEPLAAVVEMLRMAPPEGENFLVLGAGTIGLLAAQLLPNSLVVARDGSPKEEVVRRLGLNFLPLSELDDALTRTPEGQGFDYVVEATGSPSGLETAIRSVRPRGTVAAKSTHGAPVRLDYTDVVVREIRIVGSRCGPFGEAISLLRDGVVRVEPLLTSEYPLTEVVEAFRASKSRDQIKVHVIP